MPKTSRKQKNGANGKKTAPDNGDDDAARTDVAPPMPSSSEELAATLASMLRFDAARAGSEQLSPFSTTARAELPELLTTLKQLRQRINSLKNAADTALERFAPTASSSSSSTSGAPAYVEMKVQVMLSYLISLVYYLQLKVKGVPVRDHKVALRLVWARTLLEKLKPVDQRLQYQISRALQWAEKSAPTKDAGGAVDPHALRPGELAATVEDEPEDEDDAPGGGEEDDGVYRPPKISQVEYTGDHITAAEKAEKDLERKRARLERSDFMRELRSEFTDAPAEVHGSIRSAVAEKAARKLAEQQEYEEENMVRLRTSKRDTKAQKRLLKQTHVDAGGGATSLEDATDFRSLAAGLAAESGKSRGKGKRRGGTALQEYQDAMGRARRARGVVDSTLGGDLHGALGGGKRKGGGKGGGGKRRRS